MIECGMLIVSIIAVAVAVFAISMAFRVAQMTTKIHLLVDCYKECMEIGRLPKADSSFTYRLNSFLDTIEFLNDDFKNFSRQYRVSGQTQLSLNNLDQLFLKYLTKYKKYIKI
ncbi:hypothetical protein [Fibrobacter sp. UBA3718]|uniref:hypothetical protein n=1 Tax=Fibrobacter sp. UBA3718 TaxID=1946531 RepID=UPI0025B9E512|nr:hypothetical protein [Fibrobacter sp. UBA3718]